MNNKYLKISLSIPDARSEPAPLLNKGPRFTHDSLEKIRLLLSLSYGILHGIPDAVVIYHNHNKIILEYIIVRIRLTFCGK